MRHALPALARDGRRAGRARASRRTGLADAARHAVVSAIAGHPVSAQPHAGGILLLGSNRKFPASAIPTVQRTPRASAARPPSELAGTCPPARSTSARGAWTPRPSRSPRNSSARTTSSSPARACEKEGGWLPSASELLGAAERVKLESTIHDSQLTATINLDPTRGLKDEREMSSRWSRPKRARPRRASRASAKAPPATRARARPTRSPLPGQPAARIAAVRDRLQQRARRAASRARSPSTNPENFRCAFNKTPGALNKPDS